MISKGIIDVAVSLRYWRSWQWTRARWKCRQKWALTSLSSCEMWVWARSCIDILENCWVEVVWWIEGCVCKSGCLVCRRDRVRGMCVCRKKEGERLIVG